MCSRVGNNSFKVHRRFSVHNQVETMFINQIFHQKTQLVVAIATETEVYSVLQTPGEIHDILGILRSEDVV